MNRSIAAPSTGSPKHLLICGFILLALYGCGSGTGTPSAPAQAAVQVGGQTCAKTSAKIGQVATLQTRAHGVTGTAKVIDNCTIEMSNFNYDGGGLPDVFAYGGKAGNYAAGFAIGKNLFGTKVTNGSITLTLKDGDLDNLDGLSVWCVRAGVSFGDGLFIKP
jgi:Electron transfer DM13